MARGHRPVSLRFDYSCPSGLMSGEKLIANVSGPLPQSPERRDGAAAHESASGTSPLVGRVGAGVESTTPRRQVQPVYRGPVSSTADRRAPLRASMPLPPSFREWVFGTWRPAYAGPFRSALKGKRDGASEPLNAADDPERTCQRWPPFLRSPDEPPSVPHRNS